MKPEEALKQIIGNGEGGKAYLSEYEYDGEVGSIYDAMELYANQKEIKLPTEIELSPLSKSKRDYYELGWSAAIEKIKQLNKL